MLKKITTFSSDLSWLANVFTIILGVITIYSFKYGWVAVLLMTALTLTVLFASWKINKSKKKYLVSDNSIVNELDELLREIDNWNSAEKWLDRNKEKLINIGVNEIKNQKENYLLKNLGSEEAFKENLEKHFRWMSVSLKAVSTKVSINPYLVNKELQYTPFCLAFKAISNSLKEDDDTTEKIIINMFVRKINEYYC